MFLKFEWLVHKIKKGLELIDLKNQVFYMSPTFNICYLYSEDFSLASFYVETFATFKKMIGPY